MAACGGAGPADEPPAAPPAADTSVESPPGVPTPLPTDLPYVLIDLAANEIVASNRLDSLDVPVLPGSVAKVATLGAALEQGLVSSSTRLTCSGGWSSGGVNAPCTHPRLERGLSPDEALAHSCNSFFGTIATRLSRAGYNRMRSRLGLPPIGADDPLPAAALGLSGPPVSARRLLEALRRAVRPDGEGALPPAAREVVLRGLRGAAQFGTASAFASRGLTAFAKTGTAPMPGGGSQGIVVAVSPVGVPAYAIAVLAPGGAGVDAAEAAASILAERAGVRERAVTLRVGRFDTAGRTTVDTVTIEDYVAEVVAGEASSRGPAAALEAMAIVARTYALVNRGRHAADGFDLCDLTHCQVAAPATGAARGAASLTSGQVLVTSDGRLAAVFQTASCGGRTEAADAVWPDDTSASAWAHLQSRDDPPCRGQTPWWVDLDAERIAGALRQAGWRGQELRGLEIIGRTPSGRVARLRVEGLVPPTVDGETFRLAVGRALGWQHLKSTAFDVTRSSRGYRFEGHGLGHGVGLCQRGSTAWARAGRTPGEILAHYFPTTAVHTLGPGQDWLSSLAPHSGTTVSARSITLLLPGSDEDRRDDLKAIVASAVDDLERRTGRVLPPGSRLRFHPTVESFRRSTGRAWWVAGASAGDELEFLPVGVLERQQALVSTLRHELAHVLVDEALADRPLWVREGAALHFAGERPQPPPDTACPKDEALLRAPSAEAFRLAYARAAACFERALGAAGAWERVGLTRSSTASDPRPRP